MAIDVTKAKNVKDWKSHPPTGPRQNLGHAVPAEIERAIDGFLQPINLECQNGLMHTIQVKPST